MKAVFKTTAGSTGKGSDDGTRPPGAPFTVQAGDPIFREGELGTEMFIIQEGSVSISKTIAGKEHLISTLDKGDFFGEMALLEHLPRTADAVARTDVKLIPINGSRFDEMLRKNPEIAVRIIRMYSQRLREANHLIEKLAAEKGSEPIEPITALPQTPPPVQDDRDDVSGPRLVDFASGEAFYFGAGNTVLIGRADPVTGIRPDIDLTEVDINRSVSRRHAKILKTMDGWSVLEEVGTVNGTFVNDQRVPSGVPVPLAEGDRLKIGLIQFKVILDA